MGFFAGLNDEKYDRQYTDRDLMRRILEYFQPLQAWLAEQSKGQTCGW